MWANEYLGIPFRAPGFVCGDLVRKVLAEKFGVVIADDAPADIGAYLDGLKTGGDWCPVTDAKPGDVLLMNTPVGRGEVAALHVGIMATTRHVLHVDRGRHSVCEHLSSASIRHRMAGFYRHRSLV